MENCNAEFERIRRELSTLQTFLGAVDSKCDDLNDESNQHR
jgi:uncharacterized coiled-coil DUF342 family protein